MWCGVSCSVSIRQSNSGRNCLVMPSSYASLISPGRADISILTSSAWMRSALIFLSVAANSRIPSRVICSMLNPSCAANRTPRRIRSASSEKRSVAFPTHRMTRALKSSIPPNMSTRPSFSLYAMAFIVKSRRSRSSLKLLVNVTSAGWRLSSYLPSIR